MDYLLLDNIKCTDLINSPLKSTITLKPGFQGREGRLKLHHSIDCIGLYRIHIL